MGCNGGFLPLSPLQLHHQLEVRVAGLQGFDTDLLMSHLIVPVIALFFWKTCGDFDP